MKTVHRDRALVASTLAPSPERLERNQAFRATAAGLALVGLLALLAVGLLSLMGCSKPTPAAPAPDYDAQYKASLASIAQSCIELRGELQWCKDQGHDCAASQIEMPCGHTYWDGYYEEMCKEDKRKFSIFCAKNEAP